MQVWVFLLWGIASLMACWSFSIMVRWGSDWNARRRKRLTPMYSKKAFRLAPLLACVCITVAVIAGVIANQLASINGDSIGIFRSPVGFIGFLLSASGTLWIIRILIGDRARGRVRCPKCWYDMSDVPGMMCPECGRTAKSAEQFHRSRRRKWAFVVGFGMLCLGGYGVSVNKRVAESDWLAAVPSWFLMAGWEWLPEDWILYENSLYEATLDQRFDSPWWSDEDAPWISESRARRFGRRLCRGLLKDRASRWDPVRLELIDSIGGKIAWQDGEWIGLSIDIEELYVATFNDLLDALNAESPSVSQLEIIEQAEGSLSSIINLARNWIVYELNYQIPGSRKSMSDSISSLEYTYRSPIVHANFARILEPQRDRILSERLVFLLTSSSDSASACALSVVLDAGLVEQVIPVYLDPSADPNKIPARHRALHIGFSSIRFSDEGIIQLLDGVELLLYSPNENDRHHALNILYHFQLLHRMDETSTNARYNSLIELALAQTVDLRCFPSDELEKMWSYSYWSLGLKLLDKHDLDGDRAYPLIAEQLLFDASDTPYLATREGTAHIKAWMQSFAHLADSDDRDIREWVIMNLPENQGSPYDSAIHDIALRMLDDPDIDIPFIARDKLEYLSDDE